MSIHTSTVSNDSLTKQKTAERLCAGTMSFSGQPFHIPTSSSVEPDSDPLVPLQNLAKVRTEMDSLQGFLTESINADVLLSKEQMDMVSNRIASAIHEIISNGAALVSSSKNPTRTEPEAPDPNRTRIEAIKKEEEASDCRDEEGEIVEVDAMELLAEHIHYCEICGKGFKRDANLRMHMRAHGNQFKTLEALAKPSSSGSAACATEPSRKKSRFSCPYVGCNRNKGHGKFRPLKSVICVKNHFKRTHCPKMYSCNRCNNKSFSVVADLKSHLKHCGQARWRCMCGTSFSRKSKLFGHMALFEGHMPAVEDDKTASKLFVTAMEVDDDEDEVIEDGDITTSLDPIYDHNIGFSDQELFSGFGSMDDYFLQDMLGDLSQ